MIYIDIAGPAPYTLGMKKNKNGHRPNNTEQNNKHIESKVEVSPEVAAFYALYHFFTYRVMKNKSLNYFRSETVKKTMKSVFEETVTDGLYTPEIPAEFRKEEKAIRKELDKAKADVFDLEFVKGCRMVPQGKYKDAVDYIENRLQFRKKKFPHHPCEISLPPPWNESFPLKAKPNKQRA